MASLLSLYQKNGEEYYMFVNEHPKLSIQTKIPGLKGRQVDFYTNESKAFNEALSLPSYGSIIIVEGQSDKTYMDKHSYKVLDGTWKISYASSKQYPIFTDEKEITKFRDVSKTLYPNKCGTFPI